MAYRRKPTKRRSYGRKTTARKPAKRSYKRKAAPKRRKATKSRAKAPAARTIRIVIQQPVASPTLATPAAAAKPMRARFGG